MKVLRRVQLLGAVLLLASCWIYAQSSSDPGASQSGQSSQQSGSPTGEVGQPNGVTSHDNGSMKSSNKVDVEGCLNNANGGFTLTDKSGQVWQLQGKTSELSGYAGQQVKVQGKLVSGSAMSTAGPSSDATGGATGTATSNGAPSRGTTRAGNGTAQD